MSSHGGSVKVIVFALLANLGIAIAKFAGALISGSASLLAEAIHSVVDCSNQALLLLGNKRSQKPATDRHPLGYGREAFFWSFIVAILLFSLGGLFAIYEGVHKLDAHEPVSYPWLGLTILLVSIGLEGGSFWACLTEIRKQNRHGSLWAWFRKSTAAELLVIFTEDAAAMAGLSLAALFLVLSWVTGNSVWDAVGSIVVGSVLVCVAILLAIEIKALLIGEAPAEDLRPGVEAIIHEVMPGAKLLRFLALQTGASEVMLAMKIHPGPESSAREMIDRINEVERRTKARFPEIKWQFVEPDFEA